MQRRAFVGAAAGAAVSPFGIIGRARAQAITLNGASQFNDEHPYTMAMQRFADLIKKYYNQSVNFVLHKKQLAGSRKAVRRVHGRGPCG